MDLLFFLALFFFAVVAIALVFHGLAKFSHKKWDDLHNSDSFHGILKVNKTRNPYSFK